MARVVWLQPHLAKNAISEKDNSWLNDFNEQVNYREQYYRNNPLERENFERKAYLEGFAEIKVYHYHTNHLGTPQELSDEKGDIVWLSYDRAWGGQFDCFYNNQEVGNISVSEHELQPIKFQGQFFDVETGLHYNRFRYYDTDVGMFISRDPIELLGGNNIFQYAPNPTGWIDPLGLQKKSNKTPTKDCCQKEDDDECPRRDPSQSYEQALKKALAWLEPRGFKAERVNLSKFTKKPYGMMNNAGNVGFRVEYDEKCGAVLSTLWTGFFSGIFR